MLIEVRINYELLVMEDCRFVIGVLANKGVGQEGRIGRTSARFTNQRHHGRTRGAKFGYGF